MRNILLATLLFFSGLVISAEQSEEIEALRQYLLNEDYPEVFGDQNYRIDIRNILFDDLDKDGNNELIVHFKPHYRQSPTIAFYRITPEHKISRIIEGLAPGPLVQAGDYYIDSHTIAMAVDFSVQSNSEEIKAIDVIKSALDSDSFGGLVLYPNFIHADNRTHNDRPTFIDMSHADLDSAIMDCESFEFHEVSQITTGTLKGNRYLMVWVGSEIYIYRIEEFTSDGFIKKKLWIIDVPEDFSDFGNSRNLKYIAKDGKLKPFKFSPNQSLQQDASKAGAAE